MKIFFWKNNFLFRHAAFLTLLLTMASYPKSALAQEKKGNHDGGTVINITIPISIGLFSGGISIGPVNINFGSQNSGSGGQKDGPNSFNLIAPKTAFNQQNTVLVANNIVVASKNPIDVLSMINNSIGNDISFVEQDTQDLKANLQSLLPSENRVNISALAPTNASAQKLQNSISVLLKKLNEIPNDNAEVVVAKQNVLNELSKSVVGLEQTNDLIKAINEAAAKSE